jgi:hypothetical protein
MAGDIEIVRVDDPRVPELVAKGYVVVGESWGARLRLGEPPDLSRAHAAAHAAVRAAEATGFVIRELDPSWAAAVTRLESANHADYPVTPATTHPRLSEHDLLSLWASECRVFGAIADGRLVAVTVIRRRDDGRGETEFTSVDAAFRRRGLAVAVKAASIIALADDGVRVFATGGAAVNAGSIRMNEALGYVIEERWLSLEPPA